MKQASITKAPFGRAPDGAEVSLYTLANAHGTEVSITNYGGIVTAIRTPDRDGRMGNIVLGFAALEPYLEGESYFGALIGRCANRIAHGHFSLDGVEYRLNLNHGHHHLHGGAHGFDKMVWESCPSVEPGVAVLTLHRLSKDGEQGYPGNLDVTVSYLLTDENELIIRYRARTDRATPVSLTNHSYFNLAGRGTVLDHELMLCAEQYTPTDADLIPTGEIAPVAGTPFDFRTPQAIGARIEAPDPQLRQAGGYDHNLVLGRMSAGLPAISSAELDGLTGGMGGAGAPAAGAAGGPREAMGELPTTASAELDGLGEPARRRLRLAARLRDPVSGRVLELHTEEPGVQFYSGNYLDGSQGFPRWGGLCLEAQHFPDAPNHPGFPSVILRPGALYQTSSKYVFR